MAAASVWAATDATAQIKFTGTGSGGVALSASATFSIISGGAYNGDLQITLANTENTAGNATDVSADVLTALYFKGASGLTVQSEYVPSGSKSWTKSTGTPLTSDLALSSGDAEYKSGAAPGGATAGIGASGFGYFDGLDGAGYGLVSKNYAGLGVDGLSNGLASPVFQNSFVFVLSGFTGSLNDISNVSVQYGSEASDPNFSLTSVPKPTTMVAGALLLLPFGASTLRVMRKGRKA